MPRRAGARRRRRGVGVSALKDLRARLLQLVLHREGQLLEVRHAAQARELRGQLQILGDEALVFAIEEETDLAQRVDDRVRRVSSTMSARI